MNTKVNSGSACRKKMLRQLIGCITLVLFTLNIAHAEEQSTDNQQPAEENQSTKAPSKIFDLNLEDDEENEPQESADNNQAKEFVEQDNRTTAEKLEDLKSEVLAVNRDLFILEEDLLFPASTQLATYLSVDVGFFFELDNIKIKIDDEQVTHFLYTQKDIDALHKGAIQKLYLGNISTGEHEIVAIVIGTGPRKREYRKAVSFTFNKDTDAKALEIQIRDDTGKLQPSMKVVEW
jgi:hypothetical protein